MSIFENTIWLEHPEYPGYLFSPEGEAFSTKTNKLLNKSAMYNGYISIKAAGKNRLLHRIIAQIYCHGYLPGLQVNHINGLKFDNRSCNLEWTTSKENHAHAKHVLKRKFACGEDQSPLKEEEVKEIYKLRYGDRMKIGEIANKFQTTRSTVSAICLGKTWKHLFKKQKLKYKRVSSSLSHEDILAIRKLADPKKRNYAEIAKRFNTSKSMVCNIYKLKIWKDLN